MALNKLHRKDFSIAIKTGGNALDEQKFAKEASKGELFFNSNDNKLYIATTDAGITDAILKEVQLSDYSAPFVNTSSLDFDGTNDYVVGTGSTLTVGTVSCWFYNDVSIGTSTTGQVIFSQGGSDFGITLGNQTGNLTDELIFIQYGGGAFGYTATGGTISSGWHHVMMAWVSSSSTNSGNPGYDFWLDGIKVGNASGGTVPTSPDTLVSTGFYLGARVNPTVYRPFNGKIDEFALWTGDVSGDIANIYNGGNGAVDLSDSSVVGTAPNIWWRMGDNDGGSGTTVTDQGSAGVDGTVNGATFVSDTP